MINDKECTDMPDRLAKAVLNKHDDNGDGKLDFDEFFRLSQKERWLVRDFCVNACKFVVPPRKTGDSLKFRYEFKKNVSQKLQIKLMNMK